MVDRDYLTRLRASDGPSHHLLVLLDQHRVLTAGQVARATATPERTVCYRLDRLQAAGLVACTRPGREIGSAPRHWWLRPAGARLVTGTALAEGRPAGMFVAHAASIAEVWLALVEHGPSVGVEVAGWAADRAGWQTWDSPGAWSQTNRLTPDAVAHLLVGGEQVAAFVEVDLASMTQTLLRQKLARYLAYATDAAWRERFNCCPPLLLLTTTPTRAATFMRTAERLLTQQTYADADPGGGLVVAACGLVRTPARAMTEACWTLPDTNLGEVTLVEILTDRAQAQQDSAAWRTYQTTVVRHREQLDDLRSLRDTTGLLDAFASQRASEAIRALVGTDPAQFLDTESDLAGQLVEWVSARRRVGRFEARDLAQPLVAPLEARHTELWRQQAGRLLAAREHLAARPPKLWRLAAILADGHLAGLDALGVLDAPPTPNWQHLQDEALDDYPTCRAAAVEATWRALPRKMRRQTTRERLAAEYDQQHLLICDTCTIARPQPEPDEAVGYHCPHCDGNLLDWSDHDRAIPLDQHLAAIRRRLHDGAVILARADQ